MKKFQKYLVASGAALLVCTAISAQTQPNTAAQRRAIEQSIAKFQAQQDSTVASLNHSRQLYQTEFDRRTQHAQHIVELESRLYEIREQLGRLNMSLSKIEAEQLTNNFSTPTPTQTGVTGLLSQPIFAESLSKETVTRLRQSTEIQAQIPPLIQQAETLYGNLRQMKKEYDATSSQERVDVLLKESAAIKQQIRTLDQRIKVLWGELYTLKLDTYLILNDKAQVDRLMLETLSQESRNVQRNESIAERGLAPWAAMFYEQRDLVLMNEMALAQALQLPAVIDSLQREIKGLEPLQASKKNAFDNVEFLPRNLILYGAVNTSGSEALTVVNQIPELKIPQQGIYYTIQVALMQKPATSISMFRKASPLQVQNLSDGRVRYTLGGYDNYAQAQKGVSQLLKAGFRAPTLVAWVDGKFTAPLKAKEIEATRPKGSATNSATAASKSSATTGSGIFIVEVTGSINSSVSQTLRDLLAQHAPDKQTARLVQGNDYLFKVTQFENRTQAQQLVDILKQNGLPSAKVTELPKQP